jgi:hypothetical protein
MRNQNAAPSSNRSATSPSSAPAERRSRARLRDLCDEVLASFRLASQGDMFSEHDRDEGRALIGKISGLAR